MSHRKRSAEDEILPLRPAKQPRTMQPPADAEEGLFPRWKKLGFEFVDLVCETLFGRASPPEPPARPTARPTTPRALTRYHRAAAPPPESPPSSPPALARYPRAAAPPPESPPPEPKPKPSRSQGRKPTAPPPAPPSRNDMPPPKTIPIRSSRTSSSSRYQEPVAGPSNGPGTKSQNGSGKSAPYKIPTASSSNGSLTNGSQTNGGATSSSAPVSKGDLRGLLATARSQTIKPMPRPHILAHERKARVLEDQKRTREELMRELYELRRTAGYRSDFNTFRGYVDYRARLEALEKKENAKTLKPLTDSRATQGRTQSSRSLSTSSEGEFLRSAIERVRVTLEGPMPTIPQMPTIEKFLNEAKAADERIERRIRGPKRVPLPTSLPPEDDAEVDAILRKNGVVSKCAREQVSARDVSMLCPARWLNDEVINFYGALIQARSEASKENPAKGTGKPLNVHYFSSFFWPKLTAEGYEKGRLAKWTKRFDIFEKDIILIPINHGNTHWTSAAINFRRKRIETYDSMGSSGKVAQQVLRNYLDAEHRNKKNTPFDFTGWQNFTLTDGPQQENGYDCGVFTCQFMERLSRGEETMNFTQNDMPYLRRRMIWEIGNAKLRDD